MTTKTAFKLTVRDVFAACTVIKSNPGTYATREHERCLLIKTKGRYNQARLAAGRNAVLETLFKLYPTQLKNNVGRATAAFRVGAYPAEPNWEYLNELGAQALGILPKE